MAQNEEIPTAIVNNTRGPISQIRELAQYYTSNFVSRMQLAFREGLSFGGKRDAYRTFGYDLTLSYGKFVARYRRDGIAHRVVTVWPEATWRKPPSIFDVDDDKRESEFEVAWDALNKRLNMMSLFERLDILQRLGEYAVLFIGAPGVVTSPLKKVSDQSKISYLAPYGQGAARITKLVTDPSDVRFGKPLLYSVGGTDMSHLETATPLPNVEVNVDSSRVMHVAEGVLEGSLFGTPALEPIWNYLDDLRKITGGSAETYWMTGNRGIHFKMDPDYQFEDMNKINNNVQEYVHELKRVLVTQGMEAQELGTEVADGTGPFMVAIKCIAGSTGIPMRILLGSEAGELASTQDRDNWNERVNERRLAIAEPFFIKQFIDIMINIGALPQPKNNSIGVNWPDLIAFSADQKSQQALRESVAMSNYANAKSKGVTIMTSGEIRPRWFGLGAQMPVEVNQEQVKAIPPLDPNKQIQSPDPNSNDQSDQGIDSKGNPVDPAK